MIYTNDEMKCSPAPMECAQPIEPLTVQLHDAHANAVDALMMAKAINKHLFNAEDNERKEVEPMCFKDVLTNHCLCISALCKELKKIIDQLGV